MGHVKDKHEKLVLDETRMPSSGQLYRHDDDLQSNVSKSIGLHNKKIMMELITESTNMETKMLQASKYYYLISNLIFFPSIILNTFIGSIVLSFNCYAGGGAMCIINGQVDINCLENNLSNLDILDNRTTVVFMEYFLAALAFLNAILIGAQKAVKPGEKGEMFQLMARRWGAFLRQMVAYKQTTSAVNIRSRRVRSFLVTFNNLVESSPLLPRWLLKSNKKKKEGNPGNNTKSKRPSPYDVESKGTKYLNILEKGVSSISDLTTTPNFTSFLTNVHPAYTQMALFKTPKASTKQSTRNSIIEEKVLETPRLHNAGNITQVSSGMLGSISIHLDRAMVKDALMDAKIFEPESAHQDDFIVKKNIRKSFSLA